MSDGAALPGCIMSICWTSWAGRGGDKQLGSFSVWVSSSVVPLRGTKENRISNSLAALVCPPGPLCPRPTWFHLSACECSRVCFSARLFVVLLSRTGLSEELSLACWKAPEWQLGLSELSQNHGLPVSVGETAPAACLSDRLLAMITLPVLCQMLNVLLISSTQEVLVCHLSVSLLAWLRKSFRGHVHTYYCQSRVLTLLMPRFHQAVRLGLVRTPYLFLCVSIVQSCEPLNPKPHGTKFDFFCLRYQSERPVP